MVEGAKDEIVVAKPETPITDGTVEDVGGVLEVL